MNRTRDSLPVQAMLLLNADVPMLRIFSASDGQPDESIPPQSSRPRWDCSPRCHHRLAQRRRS